MDENEIKKIGHAWIRMSQSDPNSKEYEENFSISEKIFDLVQDSPEDAWIIIDFIRKETKDSVVLSAVTF